MVRVMHKPTSILNMALLLDVDAGAFLHVSLQALLLDHLKTPKGLLLH